MAGRKLKPVEGDVCWFCKQPADSDSWMGLGELKSTQEPVFEDTHYILYHEPCAVYSNGAEVSFLGMDDQTVLQFWLHGERCSGIGLKCQLCGLRGATTGCLHGPCQQFYHYPCARVRAFQGHLQFSSSCRALACDRHLSMLPHPAEEQFQGMWMEGEGGWNGMYKQQASVTWEPRYASHIAAFQARWRHLLTMTPHDQLKAQQQQEKKKRRRSSRGGRTCVDGGDSDPEFKLGKPVRTSNPGGRGRGVHQRHKQQSSTRDSAPSDSIQRLQQQQQRKIRHGPLPQRIGVPLEVAEAAQQHARSADSVPRTGTAAAGPESGAAGYTLTEQTGSGSSEHWRQQEQRQIRPRRHRNDGVVHDGEPVLDTDLLLKAAGFITTSSDTIGQAQQQEDSSIQLPQHGDDLQGATSSDHEAAAAAAAVVAAAVAAAAAADRGGSGNGAAHDAARAVTSSADSAAPARKRARPAAVDAPAGTVNTTAAAPVDDGEPEVASQDNKVQRASSAKPEAAGADALVQPSASEDEHADHAQPPAAGADAASPQHIDRKHEKQQAAAATASTSAAAAAQPEAPESGVTGGEEHDSNMQGCAVGLLKRPRVADAATGGTKAKINSRGRRKRRPAAALSAEAERVEPKTKPSPRSNISQRRHAAPAAKYEQPNPAAVSPTAVGTTAATPAAISAPNLPGWPANRGLDMFSWLQEQVKQQQQQQQQVQQQDSGHMPPGLDEADGHEPGNGMHLPLNDADPSHVQHDAAAQAAVHRSVPPADALQQAAAAAAKLAPSLEQGQRDKLFAVLKALAQAAQGPQGSAAAASAARESDSQLPQALPSLRAGGHAALTAPATSALSGPGSSSAAGNSALVPAVAELLRVLGTQLSSRKQLQDMQQRSAGLARPVGMNQYGGIEAANAAAAATAVGGSSYPRSPLAAAAASLGPPGASRLLPRMPEYFGCVTGLPPLQVGELRAAGVTAHPNVVSAYVKQDLGTALTLQPWSIVIPPSTLKQLRNSQIEPSHLASQLYQLLHASNVMNHHSTNATAASGLAGLGMMPLSGGYAGMPQDFPVRFVQGCMVPDDDARHGLPGEFALRAIQDIGVGTIIGPWRCYMMLDEEYKRLQLSVPTDWQCADYECREQAWQELLHRYTLSVRVPFLATDDSYGKVLASNPPMLHLCALGFGNLTCLVNDPLLNPTLGAATTELEQIAPPNVELCMVLVNGLPLPVLITIQQVQRGQELCCSYGREYWQVWCQLKAAAAAAVTGGMAMLQQPWMHGM